jgi:tRNA nucleotidyltransferase/poly(A) polymerase
VETLKAMKETAYLVSFLSKDRVRQELQKAVLAKAPSLYLKAMIETNLFEYMGAPFSEKLSEEEEANLLKLSSVIDESECNFIARMDLILKSLEPKRAEDLIKYLKLKEKVFLKNRMEYK